MAYLTSTNAGGKRYFYIAEYTPKKAHTARREKYIYSLGREDKAIEILTLWTLKPSFIPPKISNLGFTPKDIMTWKEKIEEKSKENCTHKTKDMVI